MIPPLFADDDLTAAEERMMICQNMISWMPKSTLVRRSSSSSSFCLLLPPAR
jgi:hypothetical protein